MTKSFFLNFAVAIVTFAAVGNSFAQQTADNATRVLTAADYARAEKMLSYNTTPLVDYAGLRANWLADNRLWYRNTTAAENEFVLINAADGSRQVFPDQAKLNQAIGAASSSPIGNQSRNPNEILSPDGKRAAFIRNYNLWMRDIASGKETQLTTDGVRDFGYATNNAGWTRSDRAVLMWSPDSKKDCDFSAGRTQNRRDVFSFDSSRTPET